MTSGAFESSDGDGCDASAGAIKASGALESGDAAIAAAGSRATAASDEQPPPLAMAALPMPLPPPV